MELTDTDDTSPKYTSPYEIWSIPYTDLTPDDTHRIQKSHEYVGRFATYNEALIAKGKIEKAILTEQLFIHSIRHDVTSVDMKFYIRNSRQEMKYIIKIGNSAWIYYNDNDFIEKIQSAVTLMERLGREKTIKCVIGSDDRKCYSDDTMEYDDEPPSLDEPSEDNSDDSDYSDEPPSLEDLSIDY